MSPAHCQLAVTKRSVSVGRSCSGWTCWQLATRFHMYARISVIFLPEVRTSAAAPAAVLGSLAELLSPNVRGGPPTVRFGALALAPVGTEALVAGAGAEPSVRPGLSKPSLDCFPHRLPMNAARCGIEDGRRRQNVDSWWRRRGELHFHVLVGEWLCVPYAGSCQGPGLRADAQGARVARVE